MYLTGSGGGHGRRAADRRASARGASDGTPQARGRRGSAPRRAPPASGAAAFGPVAVAAAVSRPPSCGGRRGRQRATPSVTLPPPLAEARGRPRAALWASGALRRPPRSQSGRRRAEPPHGTGDLVPAPKRRPRRPSREPARRARPPRVGCGQAAPRRRRVGLPGPRRANSSARRAEPRRRGGGEAGSRASPRRPPGPTSSVERVSPRQLAARPCALGHEPPTASMTDSRSSAATRTWPARPRSAGAAEARAVDRGDNGARHAAPEVGRGPRRFAARRPHSGSSAWFRLRAAGCMTPFTSRPAQKARPAPRSTTHLTLAAPRSLSARPAPRKAAMSRA